MQEKRDVPMKDILKVIDRLVREGKLVHCLIDEKPGVRLVKDVPNVD